MINLYVWPVGVEASAGARAGTRRGYNFVRGASGQDELWAVSNLNVRELAEFLKQVERPN